MLNLPIRRGLHNVQPSIFLCVFPLCLFGLLLFASWRVTDVLLIIPKYPYKVRTLREVFHARCATSNAQVAQIHLCTVLSLRGARQTKVFLLVCIIFVCIFFRGLGLFLIFAYQY